MQRQINNQNKQPQQGELKRKKSKKNYKYFLINI